MNHRRNQMQQVSTSTDCIKVYRYITQNVFSGAFQPGYKLIEKNIADACNVSRTPVREALQLLQNQKLLMADHRARQAPCRLL